MSQNNFAEDKTELRLDESNELFFKISVQGADRRPESIRLVCETGDMSYIFKGKATNEDGIVRFVVPPLKEGIVQPGELYDARVEVIIDDNYFVPVQFKAQFKQPMKVVGESVTPMTKDVVSLSENKDKIKVVAQTVSKSSFSSLREQYRNKPK
jgi:hypothetical protein